MDAVLLSRIQFGLTVGFHYLFPPLTIGLSWLIFMYNSRYQETNTFVYKQLARFWTRIFAVSFVIGVATGITMEFQFGTNWAAYSRFVGDIFGAPLAAEGVFAFFLESTFLGILLYGEKRVSSKVYWFSSLMVAVGSTLSAFWIIVANSWQQTPAGYEIVTETINGIETTRAVLTNFWQAVFNPSTLVRYFHTIAAAFATGSFFVLGTSAWQILRKRHIRFATASMRSVTFPCLASIIITVLIGHHHGHQVAKTQPVKLAAYEALWETQSNAPMMLFGWPDEDAGKNLFAIQIPGVTSLLVGGKFNTEIKGLNDFPKDERPPVAESFWAFHLMVYTAGWMALVAGFALVLWLKKSMADSRLFLWLATLSVPAPFLCNELGWIAAEIGRQPWVVYNELKTCDAISATVPAGQVLASIILFSLIYSLLFGLWIFLLRRQFAKGPEVQKGGVA